MSTGKASAGKRHCAARGAHDERQGHAHHVRGIKSRPSDRSGHCASLPARTRRYRSAPAGIVDAGHDSAVLLLDPSLIIPTVGSRASEFDAMAETVLNQRLVHKLAAVINVQRTERKGQSLTNAFERLHEQTTFSNYQGRSFGPTAGDVGQCQAVDVASAVGVPAMSNTIHLHTTRRWLVPVREGAHRNTPARTRNSAADLPHVRRTTRHSQQSADC